MRLKLPVSLVVAGLLAGQTQAVLVCAYDFDGNLLDSSGFGNDGVMSGTASYVASQGGQAIAFNNASGNSSPTRLTIPNSTSVRTLENSSFSFAIRYRSSDTGGQNGRLFGGGWGGPQIVYDYNAGASASATFQIQDSNGQVLNAGWQNSNPGAITTTGQWLWGIGVLDRENQNMRVYVNNQLIEQTNFSSLGSIAFPALTLGAVHGQLQSSATMTDVESFRLYNHALSPDEVGDLVQTVPEPGTMVVLASAALLVGWRRRRRA